MERLCWNGGNVHVMVSLIFRWWIISSKDPLSGSRCMQQCQLQCWYSKAEVIHKQSPQDPTHSWQMWEICCVVWIQILTPTFFVHSVSPTTLSVYDFWSFSFSCLSKTHQNAKRSLTLRKKYQLLNQETLLFFQKLNIMFICAHLVVTIEVFSIQHYPFKGKG